MRIHPVGFTVPAVPSVAFRFGDTVELIASLSARRGGGIVGGRDLRLEGRIVRIVSMAVLLDALAAHYLPVVRGVRLVAWLAWPPEPGPPSDRRRWRRPGPSSPRGAGVRPPDRG